MPHPVVHAEIRCSDPDAAREFYGKLFGWTYTNGAFPGYTFVDAQGDGALPTAISPLQGEGDWIDVRAVCSNLRSTERRNRRGICCTGSVGGEKSA